MKAAPLLSLLIVLCACTPQPDPRPPVQPDADAAVVEPVWPAPGDAGKDVVFVPVSGSVCRQACAVLVWLGCHEGQPTPRGESCESVCISVRAYPGLTLDAPGVAMCRDVACVRRADVKCK